jgi:hypothetical protein
MACRRGNREYLRNTRLNELWNRLENPLEVTNIRCQVDYEPFDFHKTLAAYYEFWPEGPVYLSKIP